MPFITNKKIGLFHLALFYFVLSEPKGKIALALLIISLSLTDSICAQILNPFLKVKAFTLSLEQLTF